ncbi:MAG: Asp-tRNA(Asn)/Glu-tRNA(Gln) amidotransferase subunit GatA [Candidatus Paceibacterota bacterium]|jgi:aspartyl-tRNA(Asn)/glutamyl-tRNA(Gln) amidotransferase subunit A
MELNLTIKKFHEGLQKKEFKAAEIAEDYYRKIAAEDEKIGAYLSLDKTDAISQAKKVDADLSADKEINFLAGAPLAIKDNILIENETATAASKILKHYRAAYDATVIKKLKEADAVFLGKTNLDEFAMGSSTENSGFKITHNPRDLERVPGGSSGGSAAAVAADLCVAALGSDTGGSIRQPAGFCRVVGLKPTYGAVSRFGLMAMASSLDQIGPITKTVEDAEILFNAIKGVDSLDSTSVDFKHKIQDPRFKIQGVTIGIPKEYFQEGGLSKEVSGGIDEAIKSFKKLGFEIKEISLPHTKYAVACYYIIMPAEASTNLARYDGLRYSRIKGEKITNLKEIYFDQRGEGFGPEVKKRIILGTFVLSSGYYDAYYAKAQKVRRLIKEDFEKAFDPSANGVDVILAPVAPTTAFKIGEKTTDPLEMYLSDIFTIPVNLAGLPAISIPVKKESGLPVGFQLIGKAFCEDEILSIGKQYENNV